MVSHAPACASNIARLLFATSALVALGTAARAQTETAPAASPTASSPFAQPPSAPLPTANPPGPSAPTSFSPAAMDPAAQTATGKAAERKTRIDASGNVVSEVVVTGQRAALRSSIDVKRNADIILDSINSDEAGKPAGLAVPGGSA